MASFFGVTKAQQFSKQRTVVLVNCDSQNFLFLVEFSPHGWP